MSPTERAALGSSSVGSGGDGGDAKTAATRRAGCLATRSTGMPRALPRLASPVPDDSSVATASRVYSAAASDAEAAASPGTTTSTVTLTLAASGVSETCAAVTPISLIREVKPSVAASASKS